MREDVSTADDRDVRPGVVSGGVSLLTRPAETKPESADMFQGVRSTRRAGPAGNFLSRSDALQRSVAI